MIQATTAELERRKSVVEAIFSAVKSNTRILLPQSRDSDNPFAGSVGSYSYVFEGEDDLLHLAVTNIEGSALTAEEGQAVAAFLLDGLPPGLIWIRPGEFSQHFYCGHDDVLEHVKV